MTHTRWAARFAAARAVKSMPECTHPVVEVRAKLTRTGQKRFAQICLTCGTHVPSGTWLRRADIRTPDLVPIVTRETFDAYWAARADAQQDAWQAKKTAWWDVYSAYLDSPEWKIKRGKIIARDVVCRNCGRPGDVVHHVSYQRVGDEALDDLILLCQPCHRASHREFAA